MHRYLRGVLAVAAVLVTVLAAALGVLLITGQAAVVVTHGVSMNPVYYQGDLVVVQRAPSYRIGDIVAYHLPSNGEVVLHRIIGGDAAGFQIKGDNNQSIDPTRPASDAVIGRAVLHVPQAGTWLKTLTSPPVLAAGTFALLATGGSTAFARHRRKKSAKMSRHMTHRPHPLPPIGALPLWWRIAAALMLGVGLLGSCTAALAWSTPDTAAVGTPNPSVAQMTFSYTAAVPPSAAYDGTTVTAPQPVFRKLTDGVDVHYAYQGAPGSVAVTAELSTQAGWRSSVPLIPATAFPGNRTEGTVRLDLKAIDVRAQAAAAATGIPTGPVTIALTARVHNATGDDFQPALKFNLTPLQLNLAGGPNDLTVTRTGRTDTAPAAPPAIGVAGVTVPVAAARTWSLIALAAAALAGTALVLFARRRAPRGEAENIRRRYRSMLARVQPMPIPAGHRVIDVTTFPTLAKLADRYGLLVLHWARSDVETFIVQDENTTYRYRAGSETSAGNATRIPFPTGMPRVEADA
jgi:signal peptidase I